MSLFKKVAARPWHRSQGLCSRCSAFFRALMFLFGHTIPKADRLLVDAGSPTGLVKFTESTDPPSWSSRLTKLKQGTRKPHAGSSVSPPALDKRCQKAALDALRCVLWMSHRNWPIGLVHLLIYEVCCKLGKSGMECLAGHGQPQLVKRATGCSQ